MGWTVASYEGEVKIREVANKKLNSDPMSSITLNAYNAVKLFGTGVFDLSAVFVKKSFIIEDIINLHEKVKMRRRKV